MCMEDIKIGRNSQSVQSRKTVLAGGAGQVVNEARNRIYLRIGTSDNQAVVQSVTQGQESGVGFILNATRPDYEAVIGLHGNLPTLPHTVTANGATDCVIVVIETFLLKEDF